MQGLGGLSVPKGFRGGNTSKAQLWWAVQAIIFARPPRILYRWRASSLRLFGAKVGKNVVICPSVEVTYPWRLTLGGYAWVGDEVNLYTLGEITTGAHSAVLQGSYLCTGSHDHASQHFTINVTPIVIGEKCWLATGVFVTPGVTIGNGTVVGARNSVSKSLPANVVYQGNPAVVIRERAETE